MKSVNLKSLVALSTNWKEISLSCNTKITLHFKLKLKRNMKKKTNKKDKNTIKLLKTENVKNKS